SGDDMARTGMVTSLVPDRRDLIDRVARGPTQRRAADPVDLSTKLLVVGLRHDGDLGRDAPQLVALGVEFSRILGDGHQRFRPAVLLAFDARLDRPRGGAVLGFL